MAWQRCLVTHAAHQDDDGESTALNDGAISASRRLKVCAAQLAAPAVSADASSLRE